MHNLLTDLIVISLTLSVISQPYLGSLIYNCCWIINGIIPLLVYCCLRYSYLRPIWNFNKAILDNDIDVVKQMLDSKIIDPSRNNNWAIRICCLKNYYELAEILLEDDRVDSSDELNACFGISCELGHRKLVQLLIDHPKVDGTDSDGKLLNKVASNNDVYILKLLLEYNEDIYSFNNINQALESAARNGCNKIVQILLNDPRSDPSLNCCLCLRLALKNKYVSTAYIIAESEQLTEGDYNKAIHQSICDGTIAITRVLRDLKAKYY